MRTGAEAPNWVQGASGYNAGGVRRGLWPTGGLPMRTGTTGLGSKHSGALNRGTRPHALVRSLLAACWAGCSGPETNGSAIETIVRGLKATAGTQRLQAR